MRAKALVKFVGGPKRPTITTRKSTCSLLVHASWPIRPADEIYKRFGPKNAAESIW
jgi:hypothetical protein